MDNTFSTDNVDSHRDKINSQNAEEVDAQAQVNVEDNEEGSSKKRRLTSDVWKDFDRIKNKDGSQSAQCMHCRKLLVSGPNAGTTHLKNHLLRCNKRNRTDITQYMLTTKKNAFDSTVSVENFKFSEQKSRMDFAKMVIKHNYSFSMCEHEYFEYFVQGLQPKFHLKCRNTVKADILQVYKNEKENLYKYLETLPAKYLLIVVLNTLMSWWKTNSAKYPTLAKIARDILAVPATSVASEAAFSVGGRIIDECRSSMATETVEALVTTQDWLPSRKQKLFKTLRVTGAGRIKFFNFLNGFGSRVIRSKPAPLPGLYCMVWRLNAGGIADLAMFVGGKHRSAVIVIVKRL
ncbi:hypothetical protein LXL04_021813 [Taraxacum kok-saghyz]